jgi:protoheme IX farnesyltransferase
MATALTSGGNGIPVKETLALVYSVFKVRIGTAIMLTALAGIAVAPGPAPEAWQIAVLALAVLLSSASAGAFNMYMERDLDARMNRTRNRPFVTGRFVANGYWLSGIVLLLVVAIAAAALATNAIAAFYVFLGAFVYGVVYTVWLKRRTWMNIVVGGLAGSFAILAGAAAVDPGLAPAPLILAVVLFLWTPPHFWSLAFKYKDDYAAAGVPMLPVVVNDKTAANIILGHTVLMVALSLAPIMYGMGWIYLLGAITGGGWFVRTSIGLARNPSPKTAMTNFHASLMQLCLLLTGTILDAWLL